MDHIGIVVDDLTAATDFFLELGLELLGKDSLEGRVVDRVVGLEGVRTDVVFLKTPDGHSRLELIKFNAPRHEGNSALEPSNSPGLRHVTFAVDDLDDVLERLQPHGVELVGELETYEDSYRLCYVRGPAGVILELAQKITPP